MLGTDLPLIGDHVTIEHLLAHRSGIGDYLDEEADYEVTDYLLPVAPHELATTEQYLAVLAGRPLSSGAPTALLTGMLPTACITRDTLNAWQRWQSGISGTMAGRF